MNLETNIKLKWMLFLWIASPTLLSACSCTSYEAVFCRNVHENHHIVQVVMIEHADTNYLDLMNVKIIDNINNEILEDTITIYGQDGWTCGEHLDQFNSQDTLILALNEWDLIEGEEYWYLNGLCGIHFLRYENGMIKGQITDDITTQSISEFKDNLLTCIDLQVSVSEVEQLDHQLRVYPNPVKENLQVSIQEPVIESYKIYSLTGRLTSNQNLNINESLIQVNVQELESGIYFIHIQTTKGRLIRRFVKS